MNSKIKIKLGPIEVEYEGSEEFLKKELPELLTAISRLYQETGVVLNETPVVAPTPTEKNIAPLVGTTGTIAAKLKASSGSDLALAASAKMMLGDSFPSFTRDQLLREMKTATSYYRKSYSNNLTKILNQLVKSGKLVETASNTYALGANTKNELEAQLAT
jgi:hypothetical protein